MDLDSLLKPLCGAFRPTTPIQSDWLQPFVGSNILHLCEIIAPGEEVQCISHDTLLVNPSGKQDLFLDYVPVREGKPLFDSAPLGKQAVTHYFIVRPFVIREIQRETKVSFDEATVPSLVSLWNAMGYALRQMLQKKYGGALPPLPFSSLSTFGMGIAEVRVAQMMCIKVSQGDKLKGRELLSYMDLCSVSAFVTDLVMKQAIAVGHGLSKEMDFHLIARAIKVNCPK
jgi:hypothetical protein